MYDPGGDVIKSKERVTDRGIDGTTLGCPWKNFDRMRSVSGTGGRLPNARAIARLTPAPVRASYLHADGSGFSVSLDNYHYKRRISDIFKFDAGNNAVELTLRRFTSPMVSRLKPTLFYGIGLGTTHTQTKPHGTYADQGYTEQMGGLRFLGNNVLSGFSASISAGLSKSIRLTSDTSWGQVNLGYYLMAQVNYMATGCGDVYSPTGENVFHMDSYKALTASLSIGTTLKYYFPHGFKPWIQRRADSIRQAQMGLMHRY